MAWRDEHVSRQPGLRIVVGSDPSEWLRGAAAYEFLRNEAETVGGRVSVVARDVEAYEEGEVGWGVARPTITIPDGRTVSPRWSAVFHREDGAWRLVQLHASVGVPDEVAFGDAFTA